MFLLPSKLLLSHIAFVTTIFDCWLGPQVVGPSYYIRNVIRVVIIFKHTSAKKHYMSRKQLCNTKLQTVNILWVYALNLLATNGLLEPCRSFISQWISWGSSLIYYYCCFPKAGWEQIRLSSLFSFSTTQ